MEVANALAYCDTATITAIKSFIVQAPELQWIGPTKKIDQLGHYKKNQLQN